MGWKIVRDGNEAWSRAHGVTGCWRTSPDPVAGLLKKIFEEAGEFAENRDPAELYDLADVIAELLDLLDPCCSYGPAHQAKVEVLGAFAGHVEWTPVPAEHLDEVL